MEERQSSSSSMWPLVYVGGLDIDSHDKLDWYVVDVDSLQMRKKLREDRDLIKSQLKKKIVRHRMSYWFSLRSKKKMKKKKIHRMKLRTAARLKNAHRGNCTIIGDDLYWFGQRVRRHRRHRRFSVELVKHSLNEDVNPSSWETLSSSHHDYHSIGFTLAPVGRDKLYVLRGTDEHEHDNDNHRDSSSLQDLNLCGEIFDLASNTWQDLKCGINTYPLCYTAPYVAVAKNKDGEPKEFLFYSLFKGSVLFFDLTSRELRDDQNHPYLALWPQSNGYTPKGLKHCYDIANLTRATHTPALLSNYTLYWFTSSLYLYGYDINLRRWFQSPFLGDRLPTLTPSHSRDDFFPGCCPFLVDLCNGKFMVIVPEGHGYLTVAPLTVVKNEDSLSVSVESFHPLRLDDTSFWPLAGMTVSKPKKLGNQQIGTSLGTGRNQASHHESSGHLACSPEVCPGISPRQTWKD